MAGLKTKDIEVKKMIDLPAVKQEVDTLLGVLDEEKTDDESPVIETDDEESEEVVVPDEEESNPFGDRW